MEALSPVEIIRNYEGVVILSSNTTEEDHKTIFRRNKEIIKRFKGEMNHLDTWGRRALANPIDKNKHAYYFHTTFKAGPDAVAELERTMRIDDRVLRFFHLRLDDRITLSKHLEDFKNALAETSNREKEREAKFQKKKAARQAMRPRD
jgi:small subunit ribosomal protein S6